MSVLGSTGSIGSQTLDVIRQNPEEYEVAALGANSSIDVLEQQIAEFRPRVVAVSDEEKARALSSSGSVPDGVELHAGPKALAEVSGISDVVVNGVVGFAGLPVTIEALKAGRRLALANKESLISAGPLVKKTVEEAKRQESKKQAGGPEIIPVDSEHCAVHQCLRASEFSLGAVERIVLTASGGPFRGYTKKQLQKVSLADALNHPTWDMGPKITVDSSTLMNKGLEIIEANALFDVPYEQIEVVVHPQSVVHSMVEYKDGATMAQLSLPDMKLCIGYAMAYPDRLTTPFGKINWMELDRLDFEPPDLDAFPALSLAYAAGQRGNTAPAVLNASNEVANQAFLDGRISWRAIPEVVEATLACHGDIPADSLDVVVEEDRLSRKTAEKIIEGIQQV